MSVFTRCPTHSEELPCTLCEVDRLRAINAELVAALREILPSLEHEKVHNGDGYDCQGWRAETVDACTCRVLKVIQAIAHAEGRG